MGKSDELRTKRDEQRRKYSKIDKEAKISWLGHLERMQEDRMHKKMEGHEKKGKTQERMERRSRKISSSAGSEKMERVGGR